MKPFDFSLEKEGLRVRSSTGERRWDPCACREVEWALLLERLLGPNSTCPALLVPPATGSTLWVPWAKIVGFESEIPHTHLIPQRGDDKAPPVICYRYKRRFKCMKVRDNVLPFPLLISILIRINNMSEKFILKNTLSLKKKLVRNWRCLAADQQKSLASSRAETSWALAARGKK